MCTMVGDTHRLCFGVAVLLVVDIIWVVSSELTEYLFKIENYNKPFFSTYVKTSMFTLYLLGFIFYRTWQQQCRLKSLPSYVIIDPNHEVNTVGFSDNSEDPSLSDPMYVPIKAGDKSSGTESDDSSSLGRSRSVRFSKLTEVRQLSESQADDAALARLSYTASMRAQEEAARFANKLSISQVAWIAFQFTLLWFVGNCSYQVALAQTEAGVVNVLSSTSGLFTLVMAAIFPSNVNDRFTISKFIAVLLSIAGIVLVSFSDLKFETGPFPYGVVWSLAGAFCYAAYIVLIRRKVENEDRIDITMFFGFVGLFTLLLLWPVVIVLHYTGLELFSWPNRMQWIYLGVNGIVGTVISEILWLLGCFLTSSLIGTLSTTLTIPLTMVADIFLKNIHYNVFFIVGVGPVAISFVCVTMLAYHDNWDPIGDLLRRLRQFVCSRRKTVRLRECDQEQTESLIGINANSEHDA